MYHSYCCSIVTDFAAPLLPNVLQSFLPILLQIYLPTTAIFLWMSWMAGSHTGIDFEYEKTDFWVGIVAVALPGVLGLYLLFYKVIKRLKK